MEQKLTSPWGIPDIVTNLAPGLHWVTTPSHGGYLILQSMAIRLLPPCAIDHGFLGIPCGAYYGFEEDCAWSVLESAIFSSKLSSDDILKKAVLDYVYRGGFRGTEEDYEKHCRRVASQWYPKELAAIDARYS